MIVILKNVRYNHNHNVMDETEAEANVTFMINRCRLASQNDCIT